MAEEQTNSETVAMDTTDVKNENKEKDEKNNEQSYEFKIRNASLILSRLKPGHRVWKIFELHGISWTISFYPQGRVGDHTGSLISRSSDQIPSGLVRNTSGIFLSTLDDNDDKFSYFFKMQGHKYTMASQPFESRNFVAGCSYGFDEFVPCNNLTACINQSNELVIKITLVKVDV